jgi:hypothetical protein
LLNFKLAPLNIESIAFGLESLQLDEDRARLVFAPNHSQRRKEEQSPSQSDQHFVSCDHAASLSATRRMALRERGFLEISAALE